MDVTFTRAADQNSRRTGNPLAKNARYEELDTSFFKEFYFPKNLLELATGSSAPETVTLTISSS